MKEFFQKVSVVMYWISVVGPIYSIVKGAVLGVIKEIKVVLEKQKNKK